MAICQSLDCPMYMSEPARSSTQPAGPVADVNVVVRFHRSPAIVPVAGAGGDVEPGAFGSTFEWLLQPASPKASSRTRIPAGLVQQSVPLKFLINLLS